MSAVYEAHLRMVSTLPVRTHTRKEQATAPTVSGHHRQIGVQRRQRIRELIAAGVERRDLPQLMGLHRTVIWKYLSAIKRGK